MLNLHPRIQKAAGEVHFFDRDENYLKGLEWYRKKMPHSFRGQITIEKSPSYFVTPEVSFKQIFSPSLFKSLKKNVYLLSELRGLKNVTENKKGYNTDGITRRTNFF